MGNPEDFQDMLKFFEQHQNHPSIDQTFRLKEWAEALIWKTVEIGKNTLEIE